MNRAIEQGYTYGNSEWANLGQGAPEAGDLSDAPPRISKIAISPERNEYGPVSGITHLRQAVADLYNIMYRKGKRSQYTYKNVAISGGGRLALTRVAAAIGNNNIGHFIPDYTAYEELLGIFKAFTPIPISLDPPNYSVSREALEKEIRGRGLSAILASNPCNPTGKFVHGEELSQWVEMARNEHCTFILDEFYSHYLYNGGSDNNFGCVSAAQYIEDVNNDPIVIIDGITKNWRYPGWRISWTLAPEDVIEAAASAGSFLDGGANHPLQEAAVKLLDPEITKQETRGLQNVFAKKRKYMIERLRTLGLEIEMEPEGAFYVWANLRNLPRPINEGMQFFEAGLEEKVITVPGMFFDVNPGKRRSEFHSQYKGYTRLSFGPEMETLRRGLDALERVIDRY